MPAPRLFRLLWLAVAVLALAQLTTAHAQVYQGKQLVKAELVANTTAVVPGKPFTAGLLLHMVPGWHTYWKFPGDAGIPTEIKWNLPRGWKAGEIQWPTPLKLEEPGDIRIYGYHDEVLLMQEITPPASLTEGSVKLSAEATWLVCEKLCIPGGAPLTLDLPVGSSAAPANEELFARFQRSLPQPWPADEIAAAKWTREESQLTLQVKSAVLTNHPVVEFFPAPGENVVVGHATTQRDSGGVTFTIPIDTADATITALPGVVVFGQTAEGADRNAWQISGSAAANPVNAQPARITAPARGLGTFLLLGFLGGFIL